MLAAIRQDYNAVRYASDGLRNDSAFLLECVRKCGPSFLYSLSSVAEGTGPLADHTLMNEAVAMNGLVLGLASGGIRAASESVIAALRQTPQACLFASAAALARREVLLLCAERGCFRENPSYYQHCPVFRNALRTADRATVMECVTIDGHALGY